MNGCKTYIMYERKEGENVRILLLLLKWVWVNAWVRVCIGLSNKGEKEFQSKDIDE